MSGLHTAKSLFDSHACDKKKNCRPHMCCVVSRIFYAIMAALMAFDDTIPDRRNGSVKIKFQNPVFYRADVLLVMDISPVKPLPQSLFRRYFMA